MYEAQAQLADAYLASGQAAEARVIAEDLVAREPWERAHIERFRRALVMLRVSEPDTVIAERLSGQAPFMAHDPFADLGTMPVDAGGTAPAVPTSVAAPERSTPGSTQERPPSTGPQPPPSPATTPPSSAPRRAGHTEIDLTEVLGDFGAAAPAPDAHDTPAGTGNLEQVFKEFRDAARPAGPEHAAQHMTLARTYLEMGMEQEAISSLEGAARSPRQRFEAASLLARLYMQRDDAPRAIEWLEQASQAPAPAPDAAYAVLYDLGGLLERVGETARAFAVFLELQAEAGDYRDVAERVERLARVQTGG